MVRSITVLNTTFQMNTIRWTEWYWPWHYKTWDTDYLIWSHAGGFGPFQFMWYSR